MEEIDIAELLKREKEGKAPKKIEIDGEIYIHTLYTSFLGVRYVEENNMSAYWKLNNYTIDTKIKILDKPIIEELGYELDLSVNGLIKPTEYEKRLGNCIIANAKKINEIIKHINKEGK